jgi:hypothetical protein
MPPSSFPTPLPPLGHAHPLDHLAFSFIAASALALISSGVILLSVSPVAPDPPAPLGPLFLDIVLGSKPRYGNSILSISLGLLFTPPLPAEPVR